MSITRIVAPAAWAFALVNDEWSGLSMSEHMAVTAWCRSEGIQGKTIVSMVSEPFTDRFNGQITMCVEYEFDADGRNKDGSAANVGDYRLRGQFSVDHKNSVSQFCDLLQEEVLARFFPRTKASEVGGGFIASVIYYDQQPISSDKIDKVSIELVSKRITAELSDDIEQFIAGFIGCYLEPGQEVILESSWNGDKEKVYVSFNGEISAAINSEVLFLNSKLAELQSELAEAREFIHRINNQKPVGYFRGKNMKVNGDVRFVEVEWLKTVQYNTVLYYDPTPLGLPFEAAVSGLRYETAEACGDVCAIHLGGKRYEIVSSEKGGV